MLGNFSWILVKLFDPFSNKIPTRFMHTSDLAIKLSTFDRSKMFVSIISKYPELA